MGSDDKRISCVGCGRKITWNDTLNLVWEKPYCYLCFGMMEPLIKKYQSEIKKSEEEAHALGKQEGAQEEREKLIRHFEKRRKAAFEFGDRRGRKLYEGIIASLKLKSPPTPKGAESDGKDGERG